MYCFFTETTTIEIYTLSLHDALPIWILKDHRDPLAADPAHLTVGLLEQILALEEDLTRDEPGRRRQQDRKSTRLNSSHRCISYAVFCLKKKKHAEYARQSRASRGRHS